MVGVLTDHPLGMRAAASLRSYACFMANFIKHIARLLKNTDRQGWKLPGELKITELFSAMVGVLTDHAFKMRAAADFEKLRLLYGLLH